MKPIYIPKGRAKEYGDLAINIYTGCPHRCYYCFAPSVLRKDRELFHDCITPREGIVDAVRHQLDKEKISGKTIHLCFTCDPYPNGCDTTTTREIILAIKESGNHVQILTKNGQVAMRDFDLLDANDWFGISYAGYPVYSLDPDYIPEEEPNAGAPYYRLNALETAHKQGVRTWVSAEPVLCDWDVLSLISCANYVDLWKIGKLNYHPSDINWAEFGKTAEDLLRSYHRNYYIKESLRKEMERQQP